VASDDHATLDELRRQIAIATRMLVAAGIVEYSGHLSVRIPSARDQLLIQRVDDVRSALVPEDLLLVTLDGDILSGTGKPPSELPIHTEIYRSRPDVGAAAHFHHDPTMVFSLVEGCPLQLVKNHASRWISGIPTHRDPSHIATLDQGRELAATLGSHHALLMRGHGEVVVAEDVRTLFADVVHFVENAAAFAHAAVLGPVQPLGADDMARFTATFDRARHARKLWSYYTTTHCADGVFPPEWIRA